VVSAKSGEAPLSASTTRKCPNQVAAGKPRIQGQERRRPLLVS
jgi:hypothetical protein